MTDAPVADCVVSYHHNIHTCGVARFNKYLALHLNVPMVEIADLVGSEFRYPIVSVKESEMQTSDLVPFLEMLRSVAHFSLILHDYSNSDFERELVGRASRVMGLNQQLAEKIRLERPDVLAGFTIPSYRDEVSAPTPELRLLTFGMAHKIQSAGYRKVAEMLVEDEREFVLEISSALHEGTEFDDSFFTVGDEISKCFLGRVEFLGFLADNEVSRRLTNAHAMLAFFPNGLRENNNSVVSAMRLGVPVVTNLDNASPEWAQHGVTVFDVNNLKIFPTHDELVEVGGRGRSAVTHLTYDNLVSILFS